MVERVHSRERHLGELGKLRKCRKAAEGV